MLTKIIIVIIFYHIGIVHWLKCGSAWPDKCCHFMLLCEWVLFFAVAWYRINKFIKYLRSF